MRSLAYGSETLRPPTSQRILDEARRIARVQESSGVRVVESRVDFMVGFAICHEMQLQLPATKGEHVEHAPS